MAKSAPETLHLEARPLRRWQWDRSQDEDRVTVLIPKLRSAWARRLFEKRLKCPHFKVNLDTYGSTVWELCDGQNTIREIGQQLHAKFGSDIEPVDERLVMFMRQLARSRLITYESWESSSKK